MRPLKKMVLGLSLAGLLTGTPLVAQDRDHDRDRGRVVQNRDRERHEREEHREGRRGGFFFQFGVPARPYVRNYYTPGYGYGYTSLYDIGYRDGLNLGRSDFINGFGYDPYRYLRNRDWTYRRGFEQGYRIGYGY